MAGPWDNITKRMIGANPEHFVKWLEAEATFVAALDIELKSQHIFADALLKITRREKPALLQIELQTYHDPKMLIRLLEYNVLASRQYDHLPVSSYVICLREEADVADPPLIRRFPDDEGEEVHRFYYRVIRLWKTPVDSILQLEWNGLLPLVTLTKGGKQPEVVQVMIDRLAATEEWNLLAFSRIIGGLAFKQESEQEWFRKRFNMFQDILRETWVYQEIGQEFFEEGLEKGLEQGLEKGFEKGREEERKQRIQEQREMLMSLVQIHFPDIIDLARQQAERINDPEVLRTLNLKLIATQRLDEAKQILFEADKQ
jgi:predicted transposase YdaD